MTKAAHQVSAPSEPSSVSVVIVNWNGGDAVLDCVRSALDQTRPANEVVVVDNASSDGSLERLEAEFPAVRIVRNDRNLGFGGGVNRGVEASTSNWVALLNSDAVADAYWLERMLQAASGAPECGMVACKIYLDRQAGLIDKVGHRIAVDGQNFGRGHGSTDEGQYDGLDRVAWPDGCASLWRRDTFRSVGGIDEEFFAYADDADLGIRFRLAGWLCALAPEAIVEHRHSQSLGAYSAQKLFLVERNRIWLTLKYFPWHLIALNPFLWAWRALLTMLGSRDETGPWAHVSPGDRSEVALAILRAQIAGWAGLRSQLEKRRSLTKRCDSRWPTRMREILRKDRVSLADLARGDVR